MAARTVTTAGVMVVVVVAVAMIVVMEPTVVVVVAAAVVVPAAGTGAPAAEPGVHLRGVAGVQRHRRPVRRRQSGLRVVLLDERLDRARPGDCGASNPPAERRT